MAKTDIAYLSGILLQMETIEDGFEVAIARYEYPYADGADLENMGQKARTIRVRSYFWDGSDNVTYDDHVKLINLLQQKDLLEFQHPKYGLTQVMVEQVSVRHDDTERTAEVDLTLIEYLRTEIVVEQRDVSADAEGEFVEGQAEQQAEVGEDAAAVLGDNRGFVNQVLDAGTGIYAQFTGVALAAREFVREVDSYVTMFQATVTELTNPVNSLLATVSYSTSLPGRVIGPIAAAVERTARLYDSLADSPARFLSSLKQAFAGLEESVADFSPSTSQAGTAARTLMIKQLRIAAAQRIALEAAYLYKADEAKRQTVRRAEKTRSFDILGRFIKPQPTEAVLNVRELEASLADVRTMIQAAVDEARGMRTLQTMARLILEHVNTVKLEREKIIDVELDNSMPLHLVCLRYGLPYNYAERIRSINPELRNPNFTEGEVSIYVR
ncbi:MAG: DNA circularization N-terminal domain-containing protein [Pseudomonadota bacterium]